jgi:hypothetical protein
LKKLLFVDSPRVPVGESAWFCSTLKSRLGFMRTGAVSSDPVPVGRAVLVTTREEGSMSIRGVSPTLLMDSRRIDRAKDFSMAPVPVKEKQFNSCKFDASPILSSMHHENSDLDYQAFVGLACVGRASAYG